MLIILLAKLELWIWHGIQDESGFAMDRTHTHNEMCKSTHRMVDYLNNNNGQDCQECIFPHDIAHTTSRGCMFIKKYLKIDSIYLQFILK